MDSQVQVRGFRIELGEIEAKINGFPDVKQAAVIVREDTPGDRYLAAYVVPEQGHFEISELRKNLTQRLPDYMVPNAFVSLEAMPLTPRRAKSIANACPNPTTSAC